MQKVFKYLRMKEWIAIILGVGLIVAQVWLDLKIPDYFSEINNLLRDGGGTADILTQGGFMLACAFGSAVLAVITGFLFSRMSASIAMRFRGLLFEKVNGFSMAEIKRFSTSSLITRSTNDITQVQMTIAMGFQVMIKAPILAAWAVVKIVGKNWQWSLATGCGVAFLLVLFTVIIILATPKFKAIQKLTDNLNTATRENLVGLRVVKAYNAENYQEEKFERANTDLNKNYLFANRLMAVLMPGIQIVLSGLSLAIYWIGAYLIKNTADPMVQGALFTDMMVFSGYAMQVIMAFMMIAMVFTMLPRSNVALKRICEVLDTKESIIDGDGNFTATEKGTVEFKNVCFRYENAEENVLDNISFKANTGDTVAFIGSTGSGKSSLVNLVSRFYDATEGEVLIDGHNIKSYKLKDLHNKIGHVPQKAVMFSGTVESNVLYGESANVRDLTTVKESVEVAQSKDFVEGMPESYNSHVAQAGANLSGGQKQRLSIARAIARKPEIYIFDDSFSALDYRTDKNLRKSLKEYTNDATCLIVAQRIGTIKNADKIIVLEEGKIVGDGTHEELLANNKVYQEIAYSQLSKEELENED